MGETWQKSHHYFSDEWKRQNLKDVLSDFFPPVLTDNFYKFLYPSKRMIDLLEQEEKIFKKKINKNQTVPKYYIHAIGPFDIIILGSDQKEKLQVIFNQMEPKYKSKHFDLKLDPFLPFNYFVNYKGYDGSFPKPIYPAETLYLADIENEENKIIVQDDWWKGINYSETEICRLLDPSIDVNGSDYDDRCQKGFEKIGIDQEQIFPHNDYREKVVDGLYNFIISKSNKRS